MNDTQDMQDVLVSLKNITSTMQSSLQEVQQNMVFLASGTYVGNDQNSITISFNQLSRQPKIIFINGDEDSSRDNKNFYVGIGLDKYVAGINLFVDSDGSSNECTYGGIYNVVFTTSSVTMTRFSSADRDTILNNNGVTYDYILLG